MEGPARKEGRVKFTPLALAGAFAIDLERRSDDRGFFARFWCTQELERAGLNPHIAQINTAVTTRAGTVRGMHLQMAPHAEVKIVRCLRGAVIDVIVDLRADSPTCLKSCAVEIDAANGRMVYVPEGFAHGYQTLEDDTELLYLTSHAYAPKHATGVRWDDPRFGIQWPLPITSLSDQDRGWPDFDANHPINLAGPQA